MKLSILKSEQDLTQATGDFAYLGDLSKFWKKTEEGYLLRETVETEESQKLQESFEGEESERPDREFELNWNDEVRIWDYNYAFGTKPFLAGGVQVVDPESGGVRVVLTHNPRHNPDWDGEIEYLGFE